MVESVLDALSAPAGGEDLRTGPQRYHDALEEATRRLLASGLLPKRAGQPVKALAHIHFTELLAMDQDSVLQDKWIADYRARWAGHRAAASAGPADGGAWLTGEAARAIACDAMIVPVVTGDLDPAAIEDLIALCVRYDQARHAPQDGQPQAAAQEGQPQAAAQDGQPDAIGQPDASQQPAGGTGTGDIPGGQDDRSRVTGDCQARICGGPGLRQCQRL